MKSHKAGDQSSRYARILERIFHAKFHAGRNSVPFLRDDLVKAARELKIPLPKNLGDVIYSHRYRAAMPRSIEETAGPGRTWIIRGAGTAKYCFELVSSQSLAPRSGLTPTKVPDATPGIIAKYALSDEQALLAKVRYNRLIDIFTGVACYSLQNHLRTNVPGLGQVETDELYVGVDKQGMHYVFPVQAKGRKDKVSVVKIEEDFALCAQKFPDLVCRPIAAQFLPNEVIALLEYSRDGGRVVIAAEKNYRLVPPDEVTAADLEAYKRSSSR
jgi:hypothetical protein